MDNFLMSLVCIYLLFNPFYVFSSGLPQPADYIAIIAIIAFLLSGKLKRVTHYPPIPALKYLFYLIFIVNLLTHLYLLINSQKGNPSMATLYYAYNFAFFLLVLYLSKLPKFGFYVSLYSMISLFLQLFIIMLNIGSSTGGRETGFFNNPNQLGYFALLSLSIFTVIPSSFRKNSLISFAVILASSYLVLISGSRASLVGVILLAIIIFAIEGIKLNFKYILFLLIIGFTSYNYLSKSSLISSKIEFIQARNEKKGTSFESEWRIRGYDRIELYPEYLIYGAGEMANDRFTKSYHQLEMHTAYGTILFSYGILGFILFISFFIKTIKQRPLLNTLIMLPVLSYNLTHQGLRVTLFWIFVALILYNSYEKKTNSQKNNLKYL